MRKKPEILRVLERMLSSETELTELNKESGWLTMPEVIKIFPGGHNRSIFYVIDSSHPERKCLRTVEIPHGVKGRKAYLINKDDLDAYIEARNKGLKDARKFIAANSPAPTFTIADIL